jgi:hypothetical protein
MSSIIKPPSPELGAPPTPKPPGISAPALLAKVGPHLLMILALVASVWLAFAQFIPPAVVPASAPATEFSAERAMMNPLNNVKFGQSGVWPSEAICLMFHISLLINRTAHRWKAWCVQVSYTVHRGKMKRCDLGLEDHIFKENIEAKV